MNYGYFDDENYEYVITDPRTPVKWVNYVGDLSFGGLVDHTGGSLLCAGDPAINRITKYIPQLPASEPKGQWMYLKVTRNGESRLFSPFYTPTLDPYTRYECHVGLGYQRIISEFYGIECSCTIFIPDGGQQEIRDVRVRNLNREPVKLEWTPVVEFTHFEALKQFTNADWVPQTMQCKAEMREDGSVLIRQYPFMRQDRQHNFVTTNLPAQSFQTDRSKFLGNHEYATWQHPRELDEAFLSNYQALRGDNIAAIRHDLGDLQPGQEKRMILQVGQADAGKVSEVTEAFRDPEAVDRAFDDLKTFWRDYLSVFRCETPDPAFDTMVNIHNPRQCFMTLNWSRYLSLYQLGLGARGMGFRDTSQDILGAVAHAPARCKTLLRKLLSVQKSDGSAMHQFNPLSMEANEGDAREEGEKLTYGDDHLWVVLAVCDYLKETGDQAFLDEEITFYDKKLPLEARSRATVREHLTRAVTYTRAHTGAHGLPLLGFADWNDTVNLPGDAESSFIACLYGRALLELIELMEFHGDKSAALTYRAWHAEMAETFHQAAWDGEWYIRYFTEEGDPIGSHRCDKGKIYTNAQSWAVLAGFAPADAAQQALDAVHTHLNTANGIKLSTPGYDRFDPKIGGVSTYPPGAKENGGIFLHSNPWVMIAETMVNRPERAYQYYSQINPATKNDCMEIYECEPYCYAQNILGDEHPQFGLGRNSWLSGTASWTYQAATRYILGLRAGYGGLVIHPKLPSDWENVTITRVFRGATYHFRIRSEKGDVSYQPKVVVDGEAITGNTVPVFAAGTVHEIEVTCARTLGVPAYEIEEEVK
jgi:cellobiose phosphorylase